MAHCKLSDKNNNNYYTVLNINHSFLQDIPRVSEVVTMKVDLSHKSQRLSRQTTITFAGISTNKRYNEQIKNYLTTNKEIYSETHTHTHLTTRCPGLPGWAGTR